MEGLMALTLSDTLARNLHETNARLSLWLDSLMADSASASPQPRAASPQQMAGLLAELMRAGEWLRSLPAARDEAVELELSEYRKHVERLRNLLPTIHGALLRERGRLEQERARVESAAAWARGSRQTL
jgi:hypothetical protein